MKRPLRSGFCQSGHHYLCRFELGTVRRPAQCHCNCHTHVDVSRAALEGMRDADQ